MDDQPSSSFLASSAKSALPSVEPRRHHLSSSGALNAGAPASVAIPEPPAKRRCPSPAPSQDQRPHEDHRHLTQERPSSSTWSQPGSLQLKSRSWTAHTSWPNKARATDAASAQGTMSHTAATSNTGEQKSPVSASVPGGKSTAMATAAASSPYVRRKRAVAACQFCRLRKTKCDNVRPICGSCRRHQARCVYTDGSEADGLQIGLDEAASRHREVLERLDDIRSLLGHASSPPAGARSNGALEPDKQSSVLGTLAAVPGESVDHESESAGLGAVETDSALDRRPQLPASPSDATAYLQYTKCESILKWPALNAVMDKEDATIESFIFDAHVRGDAEENGAVHVSASTQDGASPVQSSHRGVSKLSSKASDLGQGEDEQTFVTLCQKFLALVNCRNPIMDAHDLLSYARFVTEKGIGWDAKSCLVLLACALASYSRAWTPPPFIRPSSSASPKAVRRNSAIPPSVMSALNKDAAEAYYEDAQKRLGFLGTTLIDIQCFYFASLFEKFAFRPLQSWMYLQQAATRLRIHNMERLGGQNRPQASHQDHHSDSNHSTISYHFEQRAFWTIHKAEREFATELGITLASDITSFKYPAAFPTPPETLNYLIPSDDGNEGDGDNDEGDMSDVFSPRRNEFIWFFYLAQISLRRTLDEVLSVIYEKGEHSWIENIDLVCRQYHESKEQIDDWQSHLPSTMRYDPASQPNNEMGYYLEGRFEEWNEAILRPLVYYCLHHPATEPPTPSIVTLAQRYMALCVDSIKRCANHDRHGGTWFVLRRAFRCTLVILATVVADGHLRPPETWRELSQTTIATLGRWSPGVRDVQRMRRVLGRVFRAVCELKGPKSAG